jgi:hypothetical protein
MTKQAPRRKVEPDFWNSRRRFARDFLKAAQDGFALLDAGENGAPVMSNVIVAAIAYGDALTAKRANVINSEDHNAAPKLLRDVLKQGLPGAQEKRFSDTLRNKSVIQYGAKSYTRAEAEKFLAAFEKFAAWAEEQLL